MEEQTQVVVNKRPLSTLIKANPEVIEHILDRALNGERLKDIAPTYGVSLQALQAQIMRYAPDQWRDTQAARALTEYESNKQELAEAPDLLELARARDKIKCSHFELERLIPRLYGNKQEVTVTHRSDLAERIQAAERRIIDVQAEVVPPSSPEPGVG